MEGLVDGREAPEVTAIPLGEDNDELVTLRESTAPRQVKVCFTPMRTSTLATVIAQDYQGRLRAETRVMAIRLEGIPRLEWACDPHSALRRSLGALAAYLEA